MSNVRTFVTDLAVAACVAAGAGTARADGPCGDLPSHDALAAALATARAAWNGGFNLDMWATVVNRAYGGSPSNYGRANDPMIGGRIGGVNVFGGGLGLYNSARTLVGAIGVSGDTSCADHNIAWRTRNALNLDYVPAGAAALFGADPTHKDNIIFDITPQPGQTPGVSASGFGHPHCGPGPAAGESVLAAALPATK